MPHSAQQIRFAKSRDGTRIAFATCGAGPVLIWVQHWVHHLQFDWDSPVWRPWLLFLSQHHTLVRYDWRGCGLSDKDGTTFNFENLIEDLSAVIEAVGCERFTLFGMSGSGSGVCMNYAVRHPNNVTHLLLQECHAQGRSAGGPTSELVKEGEARLKVYELGWPNQTPAYGQFFTALHIPDSTPIQMQSLNDLLRQTTTPVNAVRLLQIFWSVDLRQVIPQISCPTLVLHARQNSIIPFDEGRKVATLIPGARFVPLESRNHILLDSEPAWKLFVEAIKNFLPISSNVIARVDLHKLTAREREVVEALAQGLANREIATLLKISEKTARNHVSIIFSKLGVKSRAQAIVLARKAGFGRSTIHISPD